MSTKPRMKITISECEGGWRLEWYKPVCYYLTPAQLDGDDEVFASVEKMLARVKELTKETK